MAIKQSIDDMKEIFKREASRLGDYQALSKNELAAGYIKAEQAKDTSLVSAYCAAIMLRYWFKLYQFKQSSGGMGMSVEEYIEWLEHAIMYALDHKAWLDPEKPVYGDPNGFDKVVNQCCDSTRLIYHQASNRHNRKANYNTASIDQNVDENGDCSLDYFGATEEDDSSSGAKSIIQTFLSEKRFVEALILDGICFQDSFKQSKETEMIEVEVEPDEDDEEEIDEVQTEIVPVDHYHYEYADRKLVQHLTSINPDFMKDYFEIKYGLTAEDGKAIYDTFMDEYFKTSEQEVEGKKVQVREVKGQKLYKCIEKTKLMISRNPDFIKMLVTQ